MYWRDKCVLACPCVKLASWANKGDYRSFLKFFRNRLSKRSCCADEAHYLLHTSKMLHSSADSYRGYELEQYSISKTAQLKALNGSTSNITLRCFEEKLRLSHFGEQSSRGWQADGRLSLTLDGTNEILCDVHLTPARIIYDNDSARICSVQDTHERLQLLQKDALGTSMSSETLLRTLLNLFGVFESPSFASFQSLLEKCCQSLSKL